RDMDLHVDVQVEPLGAALRGAVSDDYALAGDAVRQDSRALAGGVRDVGELVLRLGEHVPHLIHLPSEARLVARFLLLLALELLRLLRQAGQVLHRLEESHSPLASLGRTRQAYWAS